MTALYYRVASKDPNLYLDNQMHRLQSYAAENGIDAYTVYADVGFSGLTLTAPPFSKCGGLLQGTDKTDYCA